MISQRPVSVPDMEKIEKESLKSITFLVSEESKKPVEVTLKHPDDSGYIRIRKGGYDGLEVEIITTAKL